jgi:hypothetical protein
MALRQLDSTAAPANFCPGFGLAEGNTGKNQPRLFETPSLHQYSERHNRAAAHATDSFRGVGHP